MNVSLPPVEVASGRYKSASEVVREGLRLFEVRRTKLEALKRDIEAGLNSGPCAPLDIQAIKAEGRRGLAQNKCKTRR